MGAHVPTSRRLHTGRFQLLRAHSNSIEHLAPLARRALAALENARAGELRVIGV